MKLFYGPGIDHPVSKVTDVRDYLPDDKKYHYRDQFSLAEAAQSWVSANGFLPEAITKVVGSNELSAAHFEFPVTVWGGGTSMTDIMAFVPDGVIAVEAKVNEPFDDVISDWIYKEEEKNPRSAPRREKAIKRYAEAFGVDWKCLLPIRYQLLHRTLSAALTANDGAVRRAWMIVQYFPSANGDGHLINRSDFDRYIALVGSAPILKGVPVNVAWAEDDQR